MRTPPPPETGPTGPQARTYRLLLGHAMTLVRRGRIPSVPELAVKARVSRATAYRYFPSRSKLVSAVVAESLAPVRRFEPTAADGLVRVRELFDKTFPLFKRFEPHMRAALQLSLEHESLERMGLLEEEPYRRGHRQYMLHRAAAPLAATLGPEAYDRLHQGAVADLRDRVVRGAAGHLGGELPRGGGGRALDAGGADRVGAEPGAGALTLPSPRRGEGEGRASPSRSRR